MSGLCITVRTIYIYAIMKKRENTYINHAPGGECMDMGLA